MSPAEMLGVFESPPIPYQISSSPICNRTRSVEGACKTIDGYEAMHAIPKGQVRWPAKGDVVGQRQFIHMMFGIAA
jgi:hypothetical protein